MMRLLDEAIRKRAEEQAREAAVRRVYCACGCGAWWFAPCAAGRGRGRPRAYLDPWHKRWAAARKARAPRARDTRSTRRREARVLAKMD
jgi:hypothetical protein